MRLALLLLATGLLALAAPPAEAHVDAGGQCLRVAEPACTPCDEDEAFPPVLRFAHLHGPCA